MNRRFLLSVLMAVTLLSGCEKKEKEPENSGTVTLSSRKYLSDTYYVYGFSFSDAETYQYPGQNAVDLVAVELQNPDGSIAGVYFESPGNDDAFLLNGRFDTESEARDFYDNYLVAGEGNYQELTSPLEEHQVWTYKSNNDRYAKFRIIKLETLQAMGGAPYIEITLEYFYQRDGTRDLSGQD